MAKLNLTLGDLSKSEKELVMKFAIQLQTWDDERRQAVWRLLKALTKAAKVREKSK